MPAIGFLARKGESFIGKIETLSIEAPVMLEPNKSKKQPNQPDYRLTTKGIEIGAGWIKKGSESGKDYISVSIAAPEFGPKTLYCNLGKAAGQDDDDIMAMIWNPAE